MDALLELVGGDMRVLLGLALVAGTTLWLLATRSGPGRAAQLVTLRGMGEGQAVRLPLAEKEALSHDTRRFRFALPTPEHVLGLPVGQHISLRFTGPDGKLVMRSYTPVSSDDARGYVDLVVKVYFKDTHPKFPEGGKMSQHLEALAIGDTIEVAGPKGKLSYMGAGEIHILHRARDPAPEVRSAKKIGMIAGGTGITPMLQIIRRALQDPEDKTEFFLLFANQSEKDILCRDEIDAMAAQHANVHVWYTIDRAEDAAAWHFSTGFVNKDMIQKHLPAAAPDTQMLLCGPPPMLKFAVLPALEELGFTPNMHFSF